MKCTSVNRFFFILLLPAVFFCYTSSAQVNVIYPFNHVVTEPDAWVKGGTLSLPQQGENAFIKFYAGSGFNAENGQNSYVELFIRTSNGSSLNNGFAFSAFASRYGSSIEFMQAIRIVPNAPGAAATAYDIYFFTGYYTGAGFYQVTAGAAATWTHAMVKATPGTGYDVPLEFRTTNDTYLGNSTLFVSSSTGNVGIGTVTPKAKLAVYGDILATRMKVTQTGWPDYVFDSAYKLPSLREVAAFVKEHKHLPEISSAKEVEAQGLDLGQNQAGLLQKIEELTLYLIDQNQQMETQQKLIAEQQRHLSEQEKRLKLLEEQLRKISP